MLNGRKFTAYLHNDLWAKAANTTTLLENNFLTPNKNLSPFQHFFGKGERSILSSMQKFGEMVPGVNFSKNYTLALNNITSFILLLMVLDFSYSAKVNNIETAFLYGDHDEKIYMDCPQGMLNIKKDDCIILNK